MLRNEAYIVHIMYVNVYDFNVHVHDVYDFMIVCALETDLLCSSDEDLLLALPSDFFKISHYRQ